MVEFAQLVAPGGLEDFLRDTWGRSFAHLPGPRGRFRELLSWNDVNTMLQRHRLEPPRLRLVRRGEFAAKNTFLRYEGGTVPFIVPELLTQRLRDGYTLIVDAVDDIASGVMRLAEDFERVLHESVQVNLYAGWCEEQGFHRHFDTHDVVVLQIYGRKHWRVYRGGRPHPLRNDSVPPGTPPDELAWDGILEEGDVLYIPRGWWHEASGLGEVTLHLTFGIHQRTGLSLLQWMTDQLRDAEELRADLRRFANAEGRQQQLQVIREKVIAAFEDSLLDRFYSDQDSRARSRGWASLPWSVATQQPLPPHTRVALDAPRQLALRREDDSIIFQANRREWKFDALAEPLFRRLQEGPATVAELYALSDARLDEATIRAFATELATHGLLRIDGEPQP